MGSILLFTCSSRKHVCQGPVSTHHWQISTKHDGYWLADSSNRACKIFQLPSKPFHSLDRVGDDPGYFGRWLVHLPTAPTSTASHHTNYPEALDCDVLVFVTA